MRQSQIRLKKLQNSNNKIDKIQFWFGLRKNTVIVHWLFGILCAVVAVMYFPAGLALLLVFAMDEFWNDYCDGTKEGCTDWWEAFLTFCIGFTNAVGLDLAGILQIRWC